MQLSCVVDVLEPVSQGLGMGRRFVWKSLARRSGTVLLAVLLSGAAMAQVVRWSWSGMAG